MTVQRRTFLTGTAGAAFLPHHATAATNSPGPSAHAEPAALQPAAFHRLPPGAVRAQGWLATQLDRQRTGLGGRFPEVSPYLSFDQTGWVHPDLGGWEEHLWQFLPDADGYFRIRNAHSGKVLGVDVMSYEDSAQVVQFADNGTADHVWRLL